MVIIARRLQVPWARMALLAHLLWVVENAPRRWQQTHLQDLCLLRLTEERCLGVNLVSTDVLPCSKWFQEFFPSLRILMQAAVENLGLSNIKKEIS